MELPAFVQVFVNNLKRKEEDVVAFLDAKNAAVDTKGMCVCVRVCVHACVCVVFVCMCVYVHFICKSVCMLGCF
jgi:hypothetical protein